MSAVNQHVMPMHAGQNGRTFVMGTGRFTTTATTDELELPFSVLIETIHVMPLGAFDADDQPSVDETPNADGKIPMPASGTVTVTRNSSGTSGGWYTYFAVGY